MIVKSISTTAPTLVGSYNGNATPNGLRIFVQSIKNYFRFDKSSTATVDGITIAQPTTGPGRWIREGSTSPEWMLQTSWYVDSSAGNDENTGADAGHPIKTGAELSRRTANGNWRAGLYNIYVINNIVNPDYIYLTGVRPRASTIIIHGSATPGVGQTVLYNSVAGMTARTSQNRSSNIRGDITDAAVPTGNWTGAGLISTSGAPNKRIRILDGASAGAIGFPQKDLTAGKVAVSQWMNPVVNGPLTAASFNQVTVTGNEHFVVEQLTTIENLIINTVADGNGTTNTAGVGITIESINFLGGIIQTNATDPVAFIGCASVHCQGNESAVIGTFVICIACHVSGQNINGPLLLAVSGCHQTGPMAPQSGARVTIDNDTICQGSPLFIARRNGAVRIGSCASFDSTTDGAEIDQGSTVTCESLGLNLNTHLLWGTGAAGYGLRVNPGASFYYASIVPIIQASTGDSIVGGIPVAWSKSPYYNLNSHSAIGRIS